MREVSNGISGYTECKPYCSNDTHLYKGDCAADESTVDTDCCKPSCADFGATYYQNGRVCVTKCPDDA